MKILFYQKHWHSIDIEKISKSINYPLNQVANSDVYLELYTLMTELENFDLTPSFIKEKETLANWILSYLVSSGFKESKGLSVGCGTGILEKFLISSNLKIDLQECQDKSIQYLKEKHPNLWKKTKFILSEDLKNIPDSSYDFVMAITSTYPLDDGTLDCFLNGVNRILKKNGVFLWYDTAFTLFHLILKIWWFLRETKHAGMMWGWKRSMGEWKTLANKRGLSLEESFYFDSSNSLVYPKMFLKFPASDQVVWQMGIFKKND